ncbi:dihydrofolate reductase [Actinobacteria bacterium YIM 96077]|uniref:Dihydrofolate reductase n=1 Tax=Phytoactinopolyspora halophila TaxID=1981511 RepID=A0A329R3M8_9ACTN|nr:dihydrofolate reductase family protein [Phytoactinopolyspora halophila]AYY12180.1 dihydrofolate reductase [Actinobacteria bacterium YIM 96077]RAW18586.1 dihydrofolate reductase [Phytoactinopolyspora halophila]
MSKVIVDISMSLDGYMSASQVSPDEPMGEDGQRLHAWAFNGNDERNFEALANAVGGVGAIITGRRTYELSVPWWGLDGPSGSRRTPVFVLTRSVPQNVPDGGVYTFVNTGIDQALTEARTAADTADVCVMGGADVIQQFIRAGLVDELSIHMAPVLLGGGIRLFENHVANHVGLESISTITTAEATHLRFRVLNTQA